MYDKELILNILGQVKIASQRIERRFLKITSPKDFLESDEGVDKTGRYLYDAHCHRRRP